MPFFTFSRILPRSLISSCRSGLCSPRDSKESSPTPQLKSINSLVLSFLYGPNGHDYWKNHDFDFVSKVMSLLFNMLSRFVIAFLHRSKHRLISWLTSPSAVILEFLNV